MFKRYCVPFFVEYGGAGNDFLLVPPEEGSFLRVTATIITLLLLTLEEKQVFVVIRETGCNLY